MTIKGSCGSPVPTPEPEGDWLEIPAGLFDDDIGMVPDKHIYVEFTPDWDRITDGLPEFDKKQLYRFRTGKSPRE